MSVQVLIADDALDVRRGVRRLLEREHFEVVGEAADGLEAVRLAEALTPDVVILDLYMPRLDGIQAARSIRASVPRARLIMLTVDVAEEYIVAALDAGIRAYVQKADAPEDLARAIHEVCDGSRFLSMGPARVVLDALLATRAASLHDT